jgi:hypothetical protein
VKRSPEELLEQVRGLAGTLTWPTLVGAAAELVAEFAVVGMRARMAADGGERLAGEELSRKSNASPMVRRALVPLAELHGWPAVVEALGELVLEFARKGVGAHLEELDFGPPLACPRCRRGEVLRRSLAKAHKTFVTGAPIGGADTETD